MNWSPCALLPPSCISKLSGSSSRSPKRLWQRENGRYLRNRARSLRLPHLCMITTLPLLWRERVGVRGSDFGPLTSIFMEDDKECLET